MRILFQGDSITDCGRLREDTCGANTLGLGPGYPSLIASRMWCDFPEKDLEFINRGISGNRVVDLYARWKIDCLNLKPDVLSILIGVNDTWHEFEQQNGVEVPRYERIFREILQWTVDTLPNVKIVLMDPFLGYDMIPKKEFMADVVARQKVVAKLASEFNTVRIPLQDLLNEAFKRAPQNYWLVDGVHPLAAGHQLIADAWIKATAAWF